MGQKMRHAPVYFAIVQARFNTIFALDSYVAAIQERLRKQGFPDANKGLLTTVNLNMAQPTEGAPAQLPVSQTSRYTFNDIAGTSGFILDQSSLTFQTTEYDVFESFSATFLTALQAVHDAVELSYTDRIGFRYLDAILPKSGEDLTDYLSPSMLGLFKMDGKQLNHCFSETQLKLRDVNVIARAIIQHGQVGFPPDLLQMALQLPERFRQAPTWHAILDTDGFMMEREGLNLDRLRPRLQQIHDAVGEVFRAAVTEKALRTWE